MEYFNLATWVDLDQLARGHILGQSRMDSDLFHNGSLMIAWKGEILAIYSSSINKNVKINKYCGVRVNYIVYNTSGGLSRVSQVLKSVDVSCILLYQHRPHLAGGVQLQMEGYCLLKSPP